ncbi:MAG: DUF4835 domain-containing protein [Xanthomarina sp.]|uniref:type IX secretion system protein PorD n=1 Tax=Xanthomarina TaxID=1868329 RepID=UPI00058C81C1|nr:MULTISPECIES: DUF4835 family protein [Xanthomarina]MCB0389423.1 DUF4835 family protein [Winogradskyella sp.]MBF62301.1 DUF4835 domain-containing protein [Xanthomarina sp.]MDX1316311.1 DUF4835 family protein [Xanthomarina gelatinilytica]HAB27174.1 DUF4835 domain-containing protein [Xanthomarina gelatinilytica]HAI18497.1 DUF4835 domain-containing protein [Xanthomarina gelatinilytica]|tara:strand:- start:418 stop:1305 length:888 start_codon:yes stop_codon:yes gene_type:complete
MGRILVFLIWCSSVATYAQELNCNVVINAEQTGNSNLPVFKTLEKQIFEFVNTTKWTNKEFTNQERIECSMYINVTDYAGDVFNATIQVQSSRPVYGSSYTTPVHNVNDKDFTFRYLEFQNMVYNPNAFESNLISVLAFHVYMILGIDADTFELNGGDTYFKQAQNIVNYSQGQNSKGWQLSDGTQSRYVLVDNMLSQTFEAYREVMYQYHRNGLDLMHQDQKQAKSNIANALVSLEAMNRVRPNSFILRTFFDAKADEIQDIFSSGPSVSIDKLVDALNNVAPMYSSQWRNIKY